MHIIPAPFRTVHVCLLLLTHNLCLRLANFNDFNTLFITCIIVVFQESFFTKTQGTLKCIIAYYFFAVSKSSKSLIS